MRRIGIRSWRQAGERDGFVSPVGALRSRIEDNQHTPAIGKRQVTDDWCGAARRCAAAVNNQAAALEQADAGARARSSPEPDRVAAQIQGQLVQPSHRGGDRKGQLGPGT